MINSILHVCKKKTRSAFLEQNGCCHSKMMIRIGDDWNQYILEALYFSLVFGDGGIEAFVCGSITGYVVRRMYIQLHATVGKNLGQRW